MAEKKILSKKEMLEVLCSHETFQGLGLESETKFEEIIETLFVGKDSLIFEIGEQPDVMFYLYSGTLTLKFADNSKLHLVPGQIIGEISVLNGDFRLGTLTANEACQLITIDAKKIFDTNYVPPEISLAILRRFGKRVTNYLRSLQQTSTLELIAAGENEYVEFKSTIRRNIKTDKKDKNITHASLKTIAAFLNSEGGILFIGINDKGESIGLDHDMFENDDKLFLFVTDIIKTNIGTLQLDNVHYHTETINGKKILRIDVRAGDSPCYLEHEGQEHFYIRTGPLTTSLQVSKIYKYIKKRFVDNQNEDDREVSDDSTTGNMEG